MFWRKKKEKVQEEPEKPRYGIYVYTVDEKTWRTPLSEDRDALVARLQDIKARLPQAKVIEIDGDVIMVDKIVGLEVKQYVRPYRFM